MVPIAAVQFRRVTQKIFHQEGASRKVEASSESFWAATYLLNGPHRDVLAPGGPI